MSHTDETTFLKLPQWVATDKPTWLGDMNQAMTDLDTQMAAFNTKVNSFDATVAAATQAANDATVAAATATQAAEQAQQAANKAAPINSPQFTGKPTAPTLPIGDETQGLVNAKMLSNTLKNYEKATDTGWVNIYVTDSLEVVARRVGKLVIVTIDCQGGFTVGTEWKDFTTLPEQFRPDRSIRSSLSNFSGYSLALRIYNTGTIQLLSGSGDVTYFVGQVVFWAGA